LGTGGTHPSKEIEEKRMEYLQLCEIKTRPERLQKKPAAEIWVSVIDEVQERGQESWRTERNFGEQT